MSLKKMLETILKQYYKTPTEKDFLLHSPSMAAMANRRSRSQKMRARARSTAVLENGRAILLWQAGAPGGFHGPSLSAKGELHCHSRHRQVCMHPQSSIRVWFCSVGGVGYTVAYA